RSGEDTCSSITVWSSALVQEFSMADNSGAEDTLLTLTADIVAAHVSNNSVAVNDLPTLIQNVHSALTGIAGAAAAPEARPEPKVSIRASVKPDYIVCL